MKFTGSICALVTPFSGDDALDLGAFARLVEYQLTGGTQALVVAGSTGEAHALTDMEYERLLAFAVERVAKRVPVIAGTGGANTRKTVAVTRRALALHADAALVVTPYYVRPTQEGLYRHYSEVAEQGGLPIILYNVPGRTGCDLLPETVLRLRGHGNIVGIKEARAEPERMQQLLALQTDRFDVLSGDDPTAMRAMLAGARGLISVAANAVPAQMRQLCDLGVAQSVAEAQALDRSLRPLYDLLGAEPNPIPIKWCLHLLGLMDPHLRLPLTLLSASLQEKAQQVMKPFLDAASRSNAA